MWGRKKKVGIALSGGAARGIAHIGVIGWSVMVPTLIGIAVGIWADRRWPGNISWTLTFLFAGIILGCLNAWYWVEKERKEIEEENKE